MSNTIQKKEKMFHTEKKDKNATVSFESVPDLKNDIMANESLVEIFGGKAEISKDIIKDINDIDTDDAFRFSDLHFYKQNYIYRHLSDSFDKFIEEDIKNWLEYGEHVFVENLMSNTTIRYKFKFENIRIESPMLANGIEPLFPMAARHNGLTYAVKIYADVSQYQEIIDLTSDEKIINKVGESTKNVIVAKIPLMVRSKYCSLTLHKGGDKNECEFDPGRYFIVKGGEKVVICQDRNVDNKPLIHFKKDSGLYVQVNSKSYKPNGLYRSATIKFKKDTGLIIKVPNFNEINVIILLKALGLETDKSIIEYTTYDIKNTDMIDILRESLDSCKTDKGVKITTQEEAQDYLISKGKFTDKYNENNLETKHAMKKQRLILSLENDLLPHISGGMMKKAYYIGYMINKLLRAQLKQISIDDRDSYVNKRIDLVGDLMFELYKQYHKKMLNECKRFFDSRNKSTEKPINIINNLKPNIIEQGMTGALSTGRWIRRQGVAQILQRLSYLYTISLLRRIDAPGSDQSTAKLTSPRHLHPSSIGFLCCVTGDTEITMNDFTKKMIKDMKDGDEIMSVDMNSLKLVPTKIKNYFKKENQETVEITLVNNKKIKCTKDHPILCRISNANEMIEAKDIKPGYLIITMSGKSIREEYENYCKYNESCDIDMFIEKFKLNGDCMAFPVCKIENLELQSVYDFTTVAETHTLIANDFVTSNCIETPEHAKIGLTKHLSMIGSVTIMTWEQYYLINDYLMNNKLIKKIEEVSPEKLRDNNVYKVLFNGDWIGLTDKFMELSDDLDDKKSTGIFDGKNTSIVRDDDASEIRIYCDSGRLYRPVLKVENNVINLKKSHIEQISIGKNENGKKIATWDNFLIRYPNVVEYIDMELQPYVMIAPRYHNVEEMRRRMELSIDKVKDVKSQHVINRYDDMMYVKYNYCEIHPSLLTGEIMINTPFCNRNAGPRNIFQYAQGRQAMCIYTTNYRKRLDISFVLYKPQRHLVHTRGSVYTNVRHLPPGENCMVAIACYTG